MFAWWNIPLDVVAVIIAAVVGYTETDVFDSNGALIGYKLGFGVLSFGGVFFYTLFIAMYI